MKSLYEPNKPDKNLIFNKTVIEQDSADEEDGEYERSITHFSKKILQGVSPTQESMNKL